LVISRSILAFFALKHVAAGYLVYLGIATIRSGSNSLPGQDIDAGRLSKPSFVQGFANNLLNPKGTLFYLGIFTTVITPETQPSAMLVLNSAMIAHQGILLDLLCLYLGSPHSAEPHRALPTSR
jgi:threonine/homoserine/homoserine lactone efflux protein